MEMAISNVFWQGKGLSPLGVEGSWAFSIGFRCPKIFSLINHLKKN